MQKLHKFLFGALLLGSVHLNAMDLISLATEGKANEQSEGVRILNDEEMSEVVGGARVYADKPVYHYGATNNRGTKVSYTAYYRLYESYTNELRPLNVDDGSGRYVPIVAATLNHLTGNVSLSIVGMNRNNPIYLRPADRYYTNKIFNSYGRTISNEINRFIRSHSTRYWQQNGY